MVEETALDGGRAHLARRGFAAADRAGLDREQRIALAEFGLKRDVTSWDDLSLPELRRVVDMLDGWAYVMVLRSQNPTAPE